MLRTAAYPWHERHGARIVDFAGWEMPVQFSSITEEHHAVRKAAGMFDIAHMGRLEFNGPDAGKFLDSLVTNKVSSMKPGRIRYALVTKEDGGILDDVLVYCFENFYMMVVNASNRLKILDWAKENRTHSAVHIEDWTMERFMLAIQGPKALDILNPLVEDDIGELKYYRGLETRVRKIPAIVSRTGYTGEDGFEVVVPFDDALYVWEKLMDAGQSAGLQPAGLGCRDTLRLEAAMPLYGHEIDESIDPFTAGLDFAVKMDKEDFIGKRALADILSQPRRRTRVGLELAGRRIAREGCDVYAGSEEVGYVTSGTFSPTLEKSIAMAYVPPDRSEPGTELQVDIRGKREEARVVSLPFYKRQ